MIDKRTFSKKYLALILIGVAGFMAYSNTFGVPFQFDDDAYVINNPVIRTFHYFLHPSEISALTKDSPTSLPPALRYAFMTRMIGYLTFAINYALHGLDVVGYHVVNLFIHLMNGILVYWLMALTFRTPYFRSEKLKVKNGKPEETIENALPVNCRLLPLFPLVVALLFVSHPIQTQAVTYISQRFASLATLFYLLSLVLYVKWRLTSPQSGKLTIYVLSLIAAVLAMLTKEFTFTLPIVIALYEMTFLSASRSDRIRVLAPFAAALFIIPTLVFIQQGALNALETTMRTITAADVTNIPRTHYLLTQIRVIIIYLRLLVLPFNQIVDYDIPVYTSLFDMPVLISFALLLVMFSAGVYLYVAAQRNKEYPELRLAAFGIMWFFVTLSVESSFIPLGELVAEYRLYLPSVGLIAAVVSLIIYAVRLLPKSRVLNPAIVYIFFGVVVIMFSVAAFHRNSVWGSEISLWEDAVGKSPFRSRPHQNLGMYYMMSGRLQDAKREFISALSSDPKNYEIHNNLGVAYKKLGDYGAAIQEFNAALALMPTDGMAHYNLGNLYMEQGAIQEAVREYRASIALMPDYDEAHNNLGIAYAKIGQLNEAISEFTKAIGLNPQNVNARKNLADCYRKLKTPSKQ